MKTDMAVTALSLLDIVCADFQTVTAFCGVWPCF